MAHIAECLTNARRGKNRGLLESVPSGFENTPPSPEDLPGNVRGLKTAIGRTGRDLS